MLQKFEAISLLVLTFENLVTQKLTGQFLQILWPSQKRMGFRKFFFTLVNSWLVRFLAKVCRNQIRSTQVISNQKHISEGIPVYIVKIDLGYFLKMRMSENRTTEIKDPVYKVYICFFHRLEIKLKYEHSQQDKVFVL